MILRYGWSIKLAGVRLSDGWKSNIFNFSYVPSDYYQPCIFCELKPDGHDGGIVKLSRKTSKTGKRKRRMLQVIRTRIQDNFQNFQKDSPVCKIMPPLESISEPDDQEKKFHSSFGSHEVESYRPGMGKFVNSTSSSLPKISPLTSELNMTFKPVIQISLVTN